VTVKNYNKRKQTNTQKTTMKAELRIIH